MSKQPLSEASEPAQREAQKSNSQPGARPFVDRGSTDESLDELTRLRGDRYRENLEVALTMLVTIARRDGGPSGPLMRAIQIAEHVLTKGYPPEVSRVPESSSSTERINQAKDALGHIFSENALFGGRSLSAEIRAIDELIAAVGADVIREQAWQSIETAPKDGTPIVVWWEGDYHVARYEPLYVAENMCWLVRHAERSQPRIVSEIGPVTDPFQIAAGMKGPTHWMPLPAPPKETA